MKMKSCLTVCFLLLSIMLAFKVGQVNAQSPAKSSAQSTGAEFTAFVSVLRNPRCMNCHSTGNFPRQGDDSHVHAQNVIRGKDGNGVTSQKCSTCHQDHNLAGLHLPPGAPKWHLPPATTPMIWSGLSDGALCRAIKDTNANGNRSVSVLVTHMTADKLVLWAWDPGDGRAPIPMPQKEFAVKVKAWETAGAPCPEK